MKRPLLALFVLTAALPGQAVIIVGGEGRNLAPPPDSARRACWELQGQWGDFLGTPVAARWFLTAEHVYGHVGDGFVFAGKRYSAVAVERLPGTDLALWRVDGTFPRWASLSGSKELGGEILILGRGTARGAELAGHGWRWGPEDHRLSWGSNQLSHFHKSFVYGKLLAWTFDAAQGPDEGALSSGDSGGAVFVKEAEGHWRLAGVNHDINPGADGVDRFYSLSGQKEGLFRAAIYEGRGLSLGPPEHLIPLSGAKPIPMTCAATPVAPYLAWIHKTLARPDTDFPTHAPLLQTQKGRRGGLLLAGLAALLLVTRRRGAKQARARCF